LGQCRSMFGACWMIGAYRRVGVEHVQKKNIPNYIKL
jgi:hypothetical protein